MTKGQDFRPDWISPPGDTIRSLLVERGISRVEFSQQLEISTEDLRNLLDGRMTVSIGIARKLSATLGASIEFWMSRDCQYRRDAARLHDIDEKWLATLPISDMIRFGWLNPAPRASDEMVACLEFFDVPSVAAWERMFGETRAQTAFRTSQAFKSNPAAVAAWLRQGEIESSLIECAPWDPKKIQEIIPAIRRLTRKKDPKHFLPALIEYCAAAGIAVVIVRAPFGCRASGAVRFIDPDKALVQLSFRYLSDDQFWFTFFHELGHLLLHEPNEVILEEIDASVTKEEAEANEFATNVLVPREHRTSMLRLRTAREIIRFALRIGVSPGIIVGQLQHLGSLKYSQLNGLKRRFSWTK